MTAQTLVSLFQILHKPVEVSSGDRKKLANLAIKCFVQQVRHIYSKRLYITCGAANKT